MEWSPPEFVEITLGMEVTAYVNTDDRVAVSSQPSAVSQAGTAVSLLTAES